MPTRVSRGNYRQMHPGEVLMVARVIRRDNRNINWRFFVVITKHRRRLVEGRRIGAPEGKEEIRLDITDDVWTVHLLEPSEWPDGVHAFRLRMVLQGLIPDLV